MWFATLFSLGLLSLQGVSCEDEGHCHADSGKECGGGPRRKIALVTGGAGFIAHHVIEDLLENTDWNIISLDRLDFSGRPNRLTDMLEGKSAEAKDRVRVLYCDLRAPLNNQLGRDIGRVDFILHLAAAASVDRSIESPMDFVMDNTVATVNLLEFARHNQPQLERFVYFSTDEVFGPAPSGVNYKEYDRYSSANPYAASKAAGEEFAVSFENTYKMPIVITHTMNVFGERQNPTKFLPGVIRAVRDGGKVTIHSDPTMTIAGSRVYIHVKDVAEGLRFIINLPRDYRHTGDFGGAKCPKFNIVGPQEIDNLAMAKIIAESVGKELNYELMDFHSGRPGHDLRFAMSGELLKSLGWSPRVSLQERVEQFTQWTLSNTKWLD